MAMPRTLIDAVVEANRQVIPGFGVEITGRRRSPILVWERGRRRPLYRGGSEVAAIAALDARVAELEATAASAAA